MAIDDEQRGQDRVKGRKSGKKRKVRRTTVPSDHPSSPHPDSSELLLPRLPGQEEAQEERQGGRRPARRASPAASQSAHLPSLSGTTSPPHNQAVTSNSSSYTSSILPHPPITPPRHPRPHNHPAPAAAAAAAAARQPRPPPSRWDNEEDVSALPNIVECRRYRQRKERERLRPASPPEVELALPSIANEDALTNNKQGDGKRKKKKAKFPAPLPKVVTPPSDDDDEYDGDYVPTGKEIVATIRRKKLENRLREEGGEKRDAEYEETYDLRSNPFGSKAQRRRRDDGDDKGFNGGCGGGRGGLPHLRM